MKILKFYRNIEWDDKIYHEFATKLLENKLDKKQLYQVNALMVKDEELKRQKWKELKYRKATKLGLSVRKIFYKKKVNNQTT